MIRYINHTLSALLGLLFIISGYLKLFPIEMFEYNFVRLGVANWYTAPIIARLLIALEFALGAMLVFQLYLQKRTLIVTLVLLILFTIYLLVQLISEGNQGNCGCFGTYLELTPLESIIKNLMMIGVVIWLLITGVHEFIFLKNHRFIRDTLIYVILGVSLAAPFVLNTPEFIVQKQFDKNSKHYTLDLSKLYQENSHNPQVDLQKGKHILSLMSLRCEHCKTAAFKMSIMHKRHPEIPFFNLYKGNPEKYLQSFFEYTHAEDIPYMIYNTDDFVRLSGGELPAIYWLNNGVVENTSTYVSLNESEILKWLNEP